MGKHSEKFYLFIYCVSMFCLGTSTSALPVLITGISENTGLSLSVLSSVIILRSFSCVIGSFLFPYLTGKISVNRCMAIGLLLLPFSTYAYPSTPSAWVICADLLLLGFGVALVETGSNTQINRLSDKYAARGNFLQYACVSFGAFSCPYLIRLGMRTGGNFEKYPFFVLLTAIPVALILLFLQEPKYTSPQKSNDCETGSNKVLPVIILSAFFMLLASGSEVSLGNWSPAISVLEGISDEADAALLASAFAIGSMLCRLMLSALGKKMKVEWIYTGAVLFCLCSCFVMIFSSSLKLNIFLQFIYGAGNGAIFSSLLMLLRRNGQTNEKSIGLIMGFSNIGTIAISWECGRLLDRFGGRPCFVSIFVCLAAAFFLHLIIRRMTESNSKGTRLEA